MNGSSGASNSKSKKKWKGNSSLDAVDGPSAIKEAMEFSIEYAKSSRAKCRQCEEKIEKVKIKEIQKDTNNSSVLFKILIKIFVYILFHIIVYHKLDTHYCERKFMITSSFSYSYIQND